MQSNICEDKEINGVCTKGKDCPICTKSSETEKDLNYFQIKLDCYGVME
jgi:hypothetical protein